MNIKSDTPAGSLTKGEFDFKPLDTGLGFHRKGAATDLDNEGAEDFAFSPLALGGNSGTPPDGGSSALPSFSKGKAKHNSKSVSDLIAALPPSLDLLDDSVFAGATSQFGMASETSDQLQNSAIVPKPGETAARSYAAQKAREAKAQEGAQSPKRGFLNLPIGRSDYKSNEKTVSSSSLDENLAKAFPHLGRVAPTSPQSSDSIRPKKPSLGLGVPVAEISAPLAIREKPIPAHFGAAVLDALVAIGIGCTLLAITLAITNVNLLALLENSQTDMTTMAVLALLFVAGATLYVLGSRSFLGSTLGEWSYEVRVGKLADRAHWTYPLQLAWRGVLVAATGFVIFPVISNLVGRDVLRYLTGLEAVTLESGTPLQ